MINITHQSFNKDQSQSLPDASVEHQHVLVRVVPPVASPEGCSVRATNVTTWPSVLRVHDASESFPWWEKGFSQKAIKLAFWFDNVQKFHVHSIITFLLFFKSRKNQVKQKNISYVKGSSWVTHHSHPTPSTQLLTPRFDWDEAATGPIHLIRLAWSRKTLQMLPPYPIATNYSTSQQL